MASLYLACTVVEYSLIIADSPFRNYLTWMVPPSKTTLTPVDVCFSFFFELCRACACGYDPAYNETTCNHEQGALVAEAILVSQFGVDIHSGGILLASFGDRQSIDKNRYFRIAIESLCVFGQK